MTAVDHAELKRLAERAIGEPWGSITSGPKLSRDEILVRVTDDRDWPVVAEHILAAKPAVVLALLSEIEGLKAERAETEMRASEYFVVMREAQTNAAVYKHDKLEAERQLAALRTQAPDSWRPIETAPKDGVIVGWGEYRERDGFSPAFMRHYESCGWSVNAMPFYPTHWMPLPAAPALRPQTAESGK